ncbi:MAG: cobalamin-binding protein [Candidatus Dormibacteria bacterium]
MSLLPSATEILFTIGAGPEVVAVTHECDHPAAARSLPAVTASAIDHQGAACAAIDRHIRAAVHTGSSIYRLDEQRLAQLHPDLIVTQELCEVCAVAYREVEQAVRRLPSPVPVLSLEPESLDDVLASMMAVGRATGREPQAAEAVAGLRRRIAAVEGGVDPALARPRVACIEWTDPPMAAGHWVPEMVHLAGGEDVLGTPGAPSRWVTLEQVAASRPDVVVLMPCGFDLRRTLLEAAGLASREEFRQLPAYAAGRVVAVDGSAYFNRPGPRIVTGLELLAAVIRAQPRAPLPGGADWVDLGRAGAPGTG